MAIKPREDYLYLPLTQADRDRIALYGSCMRRLTPQADRDIAAGRLVKVVDGWAYPDESVGSTDGGLIETFTTDRTGRQISEFTLAPGASMRSTWMGPFLAPQYRQIKVWQNVPDASQRIAAEHRFHNGELP